MSKVYLQRRGEKLIKRRERRTGSVSMCWFETGMRFVGGIM